MENQSIIITHESFVFQNHDEFESNQNSICKILDPIGNQLPSRSPQSHIPTRRMRVYRGR